MMRAVLSADPDAVPWPDTPDGDIARRWLTPMLRDGTEAFVANAAVDLRVLVVGEGAEAVALPVTVSRPDRDLAYPASPVQHYLAYAAEEAPKLSRAAGLAARLTLTPAAAALRRTAFDRCVFVNNWLLSTNLWPAVTEAHAAAAVEALRRAFPGRAVVFKTVDAASAPALHAACHALGARLVPSRQTWTLDPHDPALDRLKNVRRDARRLAETPYRLRSGDSLSEAEIARAGELYRALYLDKYVRLNPDLTDRFLAHTAREGLLTVRAFERDASSARPAGGRIDAVLGYFVRDGVMTQPVFGYDTALPPALGLYRLLAAQVLVEARAQGPAVRVLNRSAGAGRFKSLRGATPGTEVHAVFDAHLPARQRAVWEALRRLCDGAVFPAMRRLEL